MHSLRTQPGKIQPVRCRASRFRRWRGLPRISPSQAWVDETAAEDALLIGGACFLRRTSNTCQASFFLPAIFPCTKAAVLGSTGGLHLSPRVFRQIRVDPSAQLHSSAGTSRASHFLQRFKGQSSVADVTPPPHFRSPSWKRYCYFPLTEFHLLLRLYLALTLRR